MSLRALRASDLPALASWLPRAAAGLGCERWASETALYSAVGAREALLYTEERGIAFIAYQTDAPLPHAARIELLVVEPERRRLGIGSRAALALERRLRAAQARAFAQVPAELGLALYFWLRLGYHPLTQREWPAPPQPRPAAWLARDLKPGGPLPRDRGRP